MNCDWHSAAVNQLLMRFSSAFALLRVIFSSQEVGFTSVKISIGISAGENIQQLLCVTILSHSCLMQGQK